MSQLSDHFMCVQKIEKLEQKTHKKLLEKKKSTGD